MKQLPDHAHRPGSDGARPDGPADAPAATLDELTAAVDAANRAMARAVALAGQALTDGAAEAVTGLPLEHHLRLATHTTGGDTAMLLEAADTLRALPATRTAFDDGLLSWGQIRAVVVAARVLERDQRRALDAAIGRHLADTPDADPDQLRTLVEHTVAELRPELAERRETRAIRTEFLALQPSLDPHGGGSGYFELGAESFATLTAGVDAAADRPTADDPDAPPPTGPGRQRARQRATGLVRLAEAFLAGAGASGRPRPHLLVTVDVEHVTRGHAADLLSALPGPAAAVTRRALDQLACDATLQLIVTHQGTPVAVGATQSEVTETTRRAVYARDGGCRFPGCRAPVAWCDIHHLAGKRGGHGPTNLIALCRRHHTAAHRRGWKLTLRPDATLTAARRGVAYTSLPRNQQRLHPRPRGPDP